MDRFAKETKGSNMASFLDENDSVWSYFDKNGSFISIQRKADQCVCNIIAQKAPVIRVNENLYAFHTISKANVVEAVLPVPQGFKLRGIWRCMWLRYFKVIKLEDDELSWPMKLPLFVDANDWLHQNQSLANANKQVGNEKSIKLRGVRTKETLCQLWTRAHWL